MAVVMYACYQCDIQNIARGYGLNFIKINDTEHHYIFKFSKYNNIDINHFLPTIFLNHEVYAGSVPFQAKMIHQNEQHIVIVYTTGNYSYNLKIEMDDETLIDLF